MLRLVAIAIVSLATGASALGAAHGSAARAAKAACQKPRIGFMGPITGNAAFIGKEQLGFARYAVRGLGDGKIRLVEGDTQLDPARAATVGASFHSNPDILAVVGPAGSQEVLEVAPVFKRANRLPFVSPSAINASLTNGSIPNFFRVVPNDSVQAPTNAKFIRNVLKAKNVFVVDDQTRYSKSLADAVQTKLRAAGIGVTRNSVSQKTTDFSALVSKIDDDVDVVYLPWQVAANGQIFGQQMKEQRKRAALFGSDGLDSGDFTIRGAYVSAFAPDIRRIAANKAFIDGYGARFVSNFGPPAYLAAQAAILAIKRACADGTATRAEVQRRLTATSIPETVLGGSLQFTAHGDRKGAAFSIFRLGAGGKKSQVG